MQGEDAWLGNRSWLVQEREMEKQKRKEWEEQTTKERKLPGEWIKEVYQGNEEYDWAKVGPLPRGGEGKNNKTKRKRSERDGDDMSKWTRWGSVPSREYHRLGGDNGQTAQGTTGHSAQSMNGHPAQKQHSCPTQTMKPAKYELLPDRRIVGNNARGSNDCMARSPKPVQYEMMPENMSDGQPARRTNDNMARSPIGHTAQEGDHNEDVVYKNRRVYEVLPDLTVG
eukprot:scaffold5989_cov47-Cyclotella_meneghiniana.AAC.7